MRASRRSCIPLALCAVFAVSPAASAQTPPADPAVAQALREEMAALRADFEARMSALESRLAAATGAPSAAPTAPQVPPTTAGQTGIDSSGGQPGSLPVYGGAAAASSKVFNPDIAVIGNFLGATGKNSVNPLPGLELRESELTLQAIVDPYARADFFLSFGKEGAEVEEGFVTFPTLPGGVLMKVGRMRAAFGRMNTQHPHVLPWTDRPLVTANLVGGDEGIADAGISVARLIPNPWFFLEATGQVYRGSAGDIFNASERGDVAVVGRLRGYHDLTESTNIDIGASYASGHNASGIVNDVDLGRFRTELVGVDATLRWKPLQRSIYHSFVGRFEGVMSRRNQPGGRQEATGFFVSGDYQLTRRMFAGARIDSSERAGDPSARDTGQSLVLTYWPSEFNQIRGQFRRTRYAEGITANEFLFQFQFSIGAHGAHAF